ncbi:hypothetical protein GCM10022254_72440 [Actinomadura meridiana]|uniref:Uncharacterized protein n=1 Tax=Actinomadura meridiana TaxID=559626 RepID=A0ABP8CQ29_9ACTN
MRRWRTALISAVALAALLVPVQSAVADGPGEPRQRDAKPGPSYQLGHGKKKTQARASALADHTITLRGVDINGQPVAPLASLIDLGTGTEYILSQSGGTLTGTVPDGDYSLTAIVLTGNPYAPDDLALYGDPTLTVGGDVDLTMDARTATEISSVSPSATATEYQSHAQLVQTIAGQVITTTVSGTPTTGLRAWPSASTTRPYYFTYSECKTEPLTTLPSPRVYKLAFPTTGQIPTNLTFTAPESSLALVNTTYASQGVASDGVGPHATIVDYDGIGGSVVGLTNPASAPSTQRVYYTANGVKWRSDYFYVVGGYQVAERDTGPRTFTAGTTTSETWHKAAFGPTMPVGHGQGTLIARPLLADTGTLGHENFSGNYSDGTTGTLTLYRNGTLVGQSTNPLAGDWTVPAAAANYRLDLAVQRTVPWSLYAKKINTSWTFPSAERPGDPFADQRDLLQPRITGAFDSSGRAPSGTTFPLDVVAQRAADGSAVTSVSLKASFNDGVTWTTVPLTANGTDRWTANVTHPSVNNGYVALRFTASDSSGFAVQQTVTRAYGLN